MIHGGAPLLKRLVYSKRVHTFFEEKNEALCITQCQIGIARKRTLFHEPTIYELRVEISSKQITFVRHEYGRVGVLMIGIRSSFRNIASL